MNNTIIKNIVEKNIMNSNDEYTNEVKITFEKKQEGNSVTETITLTGDGSVKVLLPV